MNDYPEDKVGKITADGREIACIERFPSLPMHDKGMMARCRQCISNGAAFNVHSDFILCFVKLPDANDKDQSFTYQIVCEGLRDKPGLCAIKAVQYTSRESDKVLSETYLNEEYESKLLESSRESKRTGLIRRVFGRKTN